MGKIDEFSAKMRENVQILDRGDGSAIATDSTITKYLVMDRLDAKLALKFDGRPLKSVAYASFLDHGQIFFHKLTGLVKELAKNDLIEESDKALKIAGAKNKSSLNRILGLTDITLFHFFNKKNRVYSPGCSASSSMMTKPFLPIYLGLLGFVMHLIYGLPPIKGTLLPGGDPALGLLTLYTSVFIFLTLRSAGRAIVSRASGCRGAPWRIGLKLGFLFFDFGSRGSLLAPRSERLSASANGMAILMIIGGALNLFANLFLVKDPLWMPIAMLTVAVSLFIVFIDLCPVGPTFMNELFSTIMKGSATETGYAYLKKRSMSRFFSSDFFEGEFSLIVFYTLTAFWAIACFVINVHWTKGNLLSLIMQLGQDSAPLIKVMISILLAGFALFSLTAIGAILMVFFGLLASVLPNISGPKPIRLESLTTDKVVEILKDLPLFHEQEPKLLQDLAKKSDNIGFSPGTLLIKQGDVGKSFYVIVEGDLEVFIEKESGAEKSLALLGKGDSFGETALIESVPRTASVRAINKGFAINISKESFDSVLENHENEDLMTIIRGANVLHSSRIFNDLDSDSMSHLLHQFARKDFKAGDTIITRGDEGKEFYLILDGTLDVLGQDDKKIIATLKKGDPLGETALLDNKPRNATVKATSEGSLLVLSREDFYKFLHNNINVGERLESLGAERSSQGVENA